MNNGAPHAGGKNDEEFGPVEFKVGKDRNHAIGSGEDRTESKHRLAKTVSSSRVGEVKDWGDICTNYFLYRLDDGRLILQEIYFDNDRYCQKWEFRLYRIDESSLSPLDIKRMNLPYETRKEINLAEL